MGSGSGSTTQHEAQMGTPTAELAVEAVASALAQARRQRSPLRAFPGEVPGSLEVAHAVQDRMVTLAGFRVAGWKVGTVQPTQAVEFGSRFVGPMCEPAIRLGADSRPAQVARPKGWFFGIEAELAFRVAHALPSRPAPYFPDEVAAAMGAMHACLEILGSPVESLVEYGSGAVIADNGLNHGLLLGPRVGDWRGRDFATRLKIGDAEGITGSTAALDGGPLGAATVCANILSERGIGVAAGQWICTGATSGLHRLIGPCLVEAEFAGVCVIRSEIVVDKGQP